MLMILCWRYNEYIEVVLVLSGMLLMILFFNFCEMYRWYDLMYFEWLNDFKFLNYFKKNNDIDYYVMNKEFNCIFLIKKFLYM